MTRYAVKSILTQTSPGAFRAVACGLDGRPVRLFTQRWSGEGEPARYGAVMDARIRTFADELRGAFCELSSGEEAFLRLKSRNGLSQGAALRVKIESEARDDKLARVSKTEDPCIARDAFDLWRESNGVSAQVEMREDREAVTAAFDDVSSPTATLPNGGTLHVGRTRALTAFDVDTAGRLDKGSAGARALSINRDAITEMARQIGLRGLGGLMVLDCLSPINADASGRLRDTGRSAFEAYGLSNVRLLKPSPLGLLEASVPWRVRPIQDIRNDDLAETTLLDLFRDVQREADAQPNAFFEVALSEQVWRAYQARRSETDQALVEAFSGRVRLDKTTAEKSEVRRT